MRRDDTARCDDARVTLCLFAGGPRIYSEHRARQVDQYPTDVVNTRGVKVFYRRERDAANFLRTGISKLKNSIQLSILAPGVTRTETQIYKAPVRFDALALIHLVWMRES